MEINNDTKEIHNKLLRTLDYNTITGIFTWKIRPCRNSTAQVGDIAGTLRRDGYVLLSFNKKRYFAHRLAWFYVTGNWPINTVDHKDSRKNHNWFSNLREATRNEQEHNQVLRVTNTSGVKGISWSKHAKKWHSYIWLNGKRIYSEHFINKDDAILAVESARINYHKDFANNGCVTA